jgi:predicted phage terminase large subunit-like protein
LYASAKNFETNLKAAEAELRRRDFGEWLTYVTPNWSWYWPHLVAVRKQLARITAGENNRLMIFLHPRLGKSEMTTIRYPVWRLERNPELKIIAGAYNQTLASKFGRKARRIAIERGLELAHDRAAADDWETVAGGGFRAVGVGAGITGLGGDLIVIDDPIKNREEANSEAYRNRVWEWYTDDLYTRLEPGGSIVLIMTRWHEDDLAGRLLGDKGGDDWTVVRIPALAETQKDRDDYHKRAYLPVGEPDPLGRKPGQATCPDRYNGDTLERIRGVLGNSFHALYQQRPTAPEGDMFKRAWFEIVNEVPDNARRIRYWDKAGTQGGGKFTCGVLLACDGKDFYVNDLVRGQWSAGAVWIEQEPGSGGKESAENTIRNLAGFKVFADKVTGDKVSRAEPFAAQCEGGNVKLRKASWNRGYLDRITAFPHGTYADDVDASSGAFNKLVRGGLQFG